MNRSIGKAVAKNVTTSTVVNREAHPTSRAVIDEDPPGFQSRS